MQQMERLLFEEFRGQQELDSEGEKTGSTVVIIRKKKHPNSELDQRSKSRTTRVLAATGTG
jgi:hypothetical protein